MSSLNVVPSSSRPQSTERPARADDRSRHGTRMAGEFTEKLRTLLSNHLWINRPASSHAPAPSSHPASIEVNGVSPADSVRPADTRGRIDMSRP